MEPSLEELKPRFLTDLVRLGRSFDGGYLVNERAIRSSTYLVSLGINDDWSFEEDFLNRNQNLSLFCFDHSVSTKIFRDNTLNALNEIASARFLLQIAKLNTRGIWQRFREFKDRFKTYSAFCSFCSRGEVFFNSLGLSNCRNNRLLTFADALQKVSCGGLPENSVFIKMDIEQSEFRVLPDLFQFEKCINGMVVEFHDLDILWPTFLDTIRTLKLSFEITHVHGNNWGGLIPNSKTPRVLEITFLKRNLIEEAGGNEATVDYPIPQLDYPNNRSWEDYPLIFEKAPYCSASQQQR